MTAQPIEPAEPVDTVAVDTLNRTLATLDANLTELSDDIVVALDFDDDLATVVGLLAELRRLEDALGKSRALVEAAVVRRMPRYEHGKRAGQPRRQATVAGFDVHVHGGSEWKEWDDSRVAFAVCGDLIVDHTTGEPIPELAQHLALFRDRWLTAASVKWRTTVLTPLGVNPENYASRVEKRHTVQLTPVVAEEVPAEGAS